MPVIAPLAAGPLNVNADDAAAAIAVGVDADELLFLTDVEGFLLDGEVVDSIDVADGRGADRRRHARPDDPPQARRRDHRRAPRRSRLHRPHRGGRS